MSAAVSPFGSGAARSSHRPNLETPVVALVGATGAGGVEIIECLQRRKFPLRQLRLFASARSAGRSMTFSGASVLVEKLREEALDGIDIALFCAGSTISKRFAPALAERGTIVIDNSSAFRMDPDVPLVVPEINADAIPQLHRVNLLVRLIISTYQAASGAGAAAMRELEESTRAHLAGQTYEPRVLPHPYAFNVFSHNTRIDPATGYNDEETKVMQEARKIFDQPALRITATCVRVPVLRAHCMSINFECERPISPQEVREILRQAPGVKLVDDVERNYFPMPKDASGRDELLVGRIRQDLSDPSNRSISLFVAGDQLLKGAALNAVQIAERLLHPRT